MALSMRIFFFQWFQGYFRKAEVQASAGQYDTSLLLYGRALQLQPNDISILNAAKRIAQLSNFDTQCKWWTLFEPCANFQLERELYFICISVEKRVPWIGIGAGAVFGMIIVILDIFFTKKPTLSVREKTHLNSFKCLNSFSNELFVFPFPASAFDDSNGDCCVSNWLWTSSRFFVLSETTKNWLAWATR